MLLKMVNLRELIYCCSSNPNTHKHMFPGLRIDALPLFTVQGKCIYTIFKAENQEIQFPVLCTKPSKDKDKFDYFKGW